MKVLLLACALASSVTPVQKVIQLLQNMHTKGTKEKRDEQVQYSAFAQWCTDTKAETKADMANSEEDIEMATAEIEKAQSVAADLTVAIEKNEKDTATYQGDQNAATKVRQIEREDFEKLHRDYSESVDALRRAIDVLKAQNFDRKQAAEALLQVRSKVAAAAVDPSMQRLEAALAQDDDDDANLAVEAPEANAYEFRSQGVVDLLEKLHGEFEQTRRDLAKKEKNDVHAYEMLMEDLKHQISTSDKQRQENSLERAAANKSEATNKGVLADAQKTLAADTATLQETEAMCTQKSSEFESRQKLRDDELFAIQQAVDIMSSKAVSGGADKHLPALVNVSLLQLRSNLNNDNDKFKAARYLQERGETLHSSILSALAMQVEADPFKKVRAMIQDLIFKLEAEANEEAENKAWCDEELVSNKNTRRQKTQEVDQLSARKAELAASNAQMTEKINLLTKEISQITSDVAKATENREKEKYNNEITVRDAKDAQAAVAQATGILRDFYARAGQATAFVQTQGGVPPATWNSEYKGMQDGNGGVMAMLEVIASDFARLEEETSAAESQAQNEFETYVQDAKVDKTQKEKDVEHASQQRSRQESDLVTTKDDLRSASRALDNANNTYDKLKSQCLDANVSHEDRVERREAEIQSLKEALDILNGISK